MADINIDTSAAGYQTRLTQFNQIVQFWKPLLKEYFDMNEEQQQAWRDNDPFLNNILRFCEAVEKRSEKDLD